MGEIMTCAGTHVSYVSICAYRPIHEPYSYLKTEPYMKKHAYPITHLYVEHMHTAIHGTHMNTSLYVEHNAYLYTHLHMEHIYMHEHASHMNTTLHMKQNCTHDTTPSMEHIYTHGHTLLHKRHLTHAHTYGRHLHT